MKKIKEAILVISSFASVPIAAYIAETLSAFDFINFNLLGMILPIPVCIAALIFIIYIIKN